MTRLSNHFSRTSWLPCLLLGILFIAFWASVADARVRASRKKIHVRSVKIEVDNVFDPNVPGENFWLFRIANALHIRTRASVIREALLFRPGDTIRESLLAESERNLRALPFLRNAHITPVALNRTDSDILVRTQDSWTTQPQINFGSEGGQSHFSAGILEENLFGYGKSFSYFYRKDSLDGVSHQFGYTDPQLLHTRAKLSTLFEDTPTGNHQNVSLARPFYSLETRAAAGISFDRSQSLQKVFENGAEISRYNLDHLDAQPFGGIRLNNDPLNVQRLNLRFRYTEQFYRTTTGTTPGSLPENTSLSGPILTWTLSQSDFIKETFVDTAERIEDINLGHSLSLGTGYYGRFMGATTNALPITAIDSFGFGGDSSWFTLLSYGMSGRYALYADRQAGGRLANTLYFVNMNFYHHWMPEFPSFTGVAHIEAAHLQNPDTDNLLSLGGNTGLRGFKVDAFTGNKTILVNLENRAYYPREILHLAYLGGALFVDAGQAQPQGLGFTTRDFHANIGAGLRIALTRSTQGTVFRIDLAYAVGPVQQGNRWILSISSGVGFKRNGNTYSKFVDVPSGS